MVDQGETKPTDDQKRSDTNEESDDRTADAFEIYEMSSEEEPEIGEVGILAQGSADTAGRWYFAPRGRAQQGPVSFSALKQQAVGRELARDDLVWREGMPEWKQAGDVAGLFGDQPPRPGPQPPGLPPRTGLALAAIFQTFRAWPDSSGSLRICAYVAAGVAGLGLVISLILWYWRYTWFTGVVLFMLVFIVCQGMAAILDAVNRLEAEDSDSGRPKDASPDGG
jgi:hypothetical protein